MQQEHRNVQQQGSFEPHVIARFFCHAKIHLGMEHIRIANHNKGEEKSNG